MIGLRPGDVTEKDQDGLLAILYGNKLPRLRKPSLVGEIERISKIKCLFEKGYVPNWCEELFQIKAGIPKCKSLFSNWRATWVMIEKCNSMSRNYIRLRKIDL